MATTFCGCFRPHVAVGMQAHFADAGPLNGRLRPGMSANRSGRPAPSASMSTT